MAVVSRYSRLGVTATLNVMSADVLIVTTKANYERFFWRDDRKGNYCCFAATRLDVFFCWAMASFATSLRIRQVGYYAFKMRVFVEILPNRWMASSAYGIANVLVRELIV